MSNIYYPNPDIETRNRVQSLGTYSESKKYVATSLVVRHFLDLLDVLRGCAIIVFSISGLGYYPHLVARITLAISIFFCISCTEKELDHSNHLVKNKSLFTVSQLGGYINKPDKPFQHYQKFTPEFKIYETLDSGVAVIDIDNDGRHEIFFAQFDKNHTASVLYKIENDKYIDITQQAGLSNLTAIMGAATADINNDGWEDILIYGYKQLHLMLNIEGKFTKLTLPILPENSFYTSATFFNANNGVICLHIAPFLLPTK